MPTIIDTPAEVREWKERMLRVAHAHHVLVPDRFDVAVPTMGEYARDLMHVLASHANGYHGQHVPDDRTLNGALQAWLRAVDPQQTSPARLVQPIPAGSYNAHVIGGEHPTEGLPGYPAYDFGAIAGAPVVAVEAGKVERFSGHDPAAGPVEGVHGPFGWSIYLLGASGTDYYYTHLGTRLVNVGQIVTAGQRIATVGNYGAFGGADHVHLGVRPGGPGSPTVEDIYHAPHVNTA